MGLVFCFMFAFFGILLSAGCSISSSASRRDTERRIRDGCEKIAAERKWFSGRFVMTDEEEYDFEQELSSDSGLHYAYKTCKEFCKSIPECDVWFSNGFDGFVNVVLTDRRIAVTVMRIMAAELGKITNFDSRGIERGIITVEDKRYYTLENKILQLIDKKLMSCGCPPLLFTSSGFDYNLSGAKYVLASVQKVREFNDGVYTPGSFKWMNAGMYSSAEMVYLDRGGLASL